MGKAALGSVEPTGEEIFRVREVPSHQTNRARSGAGEQGEAEKGAKPNSIICAVTLMLFVSSFLPVCVLFVLPLGPHRRHLLSWHQDFFWKEARSDDWRDYLHWSCDLRCHPLVGPM
jgi:hypothetical protein